MSNQKNILITGVTGNLGSELLKLMLLADVGKKTKLFLLVRAKNKACAKKRICDLFKFLFKEEYKKFLNSNIKILVGDVSKKRIGLSDEDYEILIGQIDVIYHAAALTRFQDPLPKQITTNVLGTKRILDIVSYGKKEIELHYVSTIFVAGTFKGKFREDDFDVGQEFNNPYEQSKFEAEKIVRKFSRAGRKICIYRPSIIVGEYQSGSIINFQMFYHALYLISRGVINKIPVNKNTLIHLIPVDVAAQMIFKLSNDCNNVKNDNSTYHILSPKLLSIGAINKIIKEYLHIKGPKLNDAIDNKLRDETHNDLYNKFLKSLVSYLQFNAKVECRYTMSKLNVLNYKSSPVNEAYIKRLLSYTIKTGYIKE